MIADRRILITGAARGIGAATARRLHERGARLALLTSEGFEDVIAKEFPNIQIVARQFGMSDRAKSRDAAENILSAHTDLDGVFASSEPSSVGAARTTVVYPSKPFTSIGSA